MFQLYSSCAPSVHHPSFIDHNSKDDLYPPRSPSSTCFSPNIVHAVGVPADLKGPNESIPLLCSSCIPVVPPMRPLLLSSTTIVKTTSIPLYHPHPHVCHQTRPPPVGVLADLKWPNESIQFVLELCSNCTPIAPHPSFIDHNSKDGLYPPNPNHRHVFQQTGSPL